MFFFCFSYHLEKIYKQYIQYTIYINYSRMSAGQTTTHLNCRPDGSSDHLRNHPHIILTNLNFIVPSSAKAKQFSYRHKTAVL